MVSARPIVTAAVLSRAVVVIARSRAARRNMPSAAGSTSDADTMSEAIAAATSRQRLEARDGRASMSDSTLLDRRLAAARRDAVVGRCRGAARAARSAAGGASTGFTAPHVRPRHRCGRPRRARIAATLGLSRRVHVVDSPLVDTPTVIGWVKPVILLPIAAFAGLSPSQVEAILAHELAHIRRHDFLVNLLQTFAETMLFYHPAVWWLSARIRTEREHCCDSVALSVCGDAVSYAEALVELESWRTVHSRLAVAATGGTLMTQSSPSARCARRRSPALVRSAGRRRRRDARHLRRRRVALPPRCAA